MRMEDKKRKLLISDLDGTLLFPKGEKRIFREKDIEAIRQFQKQGNLVVINSGRTVSWLTEPLKDYIDWDYLIASTGAVIVGKQRCENTEEMKVVAQHAIRKNSLEKLLGKLKGQKGITVQTLQHVYAWNPDNLYGMPIIPIASLGEIQEDIFGVSIHFETDSEASKFATWFQKEQITDIACYQNRVDIDMVAAKCSKGTGIQELIAYLKIPMEQCYVIGDSYNDMEMLHAVENAFTFHDAPEEVRKSAKYQVASVAEMIGCQPFLKMS